MAVAPLPPWRCRRRPGPTRCACPPCQPHSNDGIVILRRGYSYDNGTDDHGQADAGLMLLLYQRDPRRQFIPLQTRLAAHDALLPLTRTLSSAIFAIPPGSEPGHPLAHRLLDE